MHRFVTVAAGFAIAACADQPLTTAAGGRETATPTLTTGEAPVVFNTQLRAENEPNAASSSESKGHAQVVVQPDGTVEFMLFLNNKGNETFTRAHIHKAPEGSNGPIHWDLHEAPDAPFADDHATLRGVARPRAAANVADLVANPSQYYVNVHSVSVPGGVVRGQLP
ncbi:MAG TPA: CHRD domain-containing protein [Gemmatimonadales bacterium]